MILAIAAVTVLASSLSGCIVVPERGYYYGPPGYYYHGGYYDHDHDRRW
ncbi:MAG TPA: hypothetical protein VF472_00050 [Burkholderiaceae bacterium]